MYSTGNAWILGDEYQNYGLSTTGVSVYVAEEDCKTLVTQEIFYAKCSDSNGLYGRVGTNRNLCGADRREYEDSFFAYVGSMYIIFFTSLSILQNSLFWFLFLCFDIFVILRVAEPLCEALTENIQHGDRTPEWKGPRLSKYTYSCHHGYQLIGSSVVSCNDQGQWSSNPPTCRRK